MQSEQKATKDVRIILKQFLTVMVSGPQTAVKF
jgi:hypothetical protein